MRLALALALALAGCSTTLSNPESAWSCDGGDDRLLAESRCAKVSTEIERIRTIFPAWAPAGLHVTWIDGGDACEGYGCDGLQDGVTFDPETIVITTERVLVHEIAHAQRWRALGDPDVEHADPYLWSWVEANKPARTTRAEGAQKVIP